jgi:ParB/Sulfiredoxin domain
MMQNEAAASAPKAVTVGQRTFTLPFADLLPELSERELTDLREDIRCNGVVVPIIVDEHDGVIDGVHRLILAAEVGLTDVPVVVRAGLTHARKTALAISINADRRQLGPETIKRLKAERVGRVVAARREGMSYRKIAEQEGVSEKQVREDLKKATAEGYAVDPRGGQVKCKDGRTRSATRKRKPKPRQPSAAQRPATVAPAEPATGTSPGKSSDGEGGLHGLRSELESLGRDQDALAAVGFVIAALLGEQGDQWRTFLRMLTAAAGESLGKLKADLTREREGAAAPSSNVDAAEMALAELGEGASHDELKQWAARQWPGVSLRRKDVDRARKRRQRRQAGPAPADGRR